MCWIGSRPVRSTTRAGIDQPHPLSQLAFLILELGLWRSYTKLKIKKPSTLHYHTVGRPSSNCDNPIHASWSQARDRLRFAPLNVPRCHSSYPTAGSSVSMDRFIVYHPRQQIRVGKRGRQDGRSLPEFLVDYISHQIDITNKWVFQLSKKPSNRAQRGDIWLSIHSLCPTPNRTRHTRLGVRCIEASEWQISSARSWVGILRASSLSTGPYFGS